MSVFLLDGKVAETSAKLHETDLAGRKSPGQTGADHARYPFALLILADDRIGSAAHSTAL